MSAAVLSDRGASRLAGGLAATMGLALAGAGWWVSTPVASAAEVQHAALAAELPGLVELAEVWLASPASSPCQTAADDLGQAAEAVAGGDLDTAADMAVIAAVLIEQCGWNVSDTTTGGAYR